MRGTIGFVKILYKKDGIDEVVKALLEGVKPSRGAIVVLLEGDLGAGKTTLTQVLAKELGYFGEVVSPTFVIQKRYKIEHGFLRNLIHIDAYRLSGAKEIEMLGWKNWIDNPENLIVVEWPNIIAEALPAAVIKVSIKHIDEDTREAEIYYGN
jgi:tRNA threonylcarbamoyladenosine biosynthesis protein TsaE